MLPGLAVSGRSLHGPQRTDQLLTAGRQFVEHLARELGDLSDPRVGRRRLNGTLVELPGTVPVTAQEVAVGDTDLGAGNLLLHDELVPVGVPRIEGPEVLGRAQHGTEMPPAQQVLARRRRLQARG